jgi:hypothetical protein
MQEIKDLQRFTANHSNKPAAKKQALLSKIGFSPHSNSGPFPEAGAGTLELDPPAQVLRRIAHVL